MLKRLTSLPFFVLLMGIGGLAMIFPALHAYGRSDYFTARIFLYGTILASFLTLLIGLATSTYAPKSVPRSQLIALLAAFCLLPAMFAIPFYEAMPSISFLDAWFEMVSSFTTTGATLFDRPFRVNPSLHLWRALVGWMGGLLIWVAALAILAPMNLGGFEVQATQSTSDRALRHSRSEKRLEPSERLARYALRLIPIYAGLTLALWVGLMLTGERPLVALCHAMSVMSTSGISPVGGIQYGASGVAGEVIVFVFLFFALSRLTFSRGMLGDDRKSLWRDPEFRLGLILLAIVPTLLFLRHFMAAATEGADATYLGAALSAIWGALFTVLSFMTTTGFESVHWIGATEWSGLQTPGLILVGLALIGGGVATTAGGVKLLRVYVLYRHGLRELERLVHPNSIGNDGAELRQIRRRGALIAFVFFMLFALSIAAVMLALSLTGMQFETAMVLAVSALATTGPLAEVAAENPVLYGGIPDAAKMILAVTMVLGRLELLAIIALLNPDIWRS